jgi:hypothetical protein
MRPRSNFCFLVFLVSGYPAIGLAQNVDIVNRFCTDGIIVPPMLEKPFRIPVGCEVIDCCPGCPGGELEWRIQIGSKAFRGAELRFQGLSRAQLEQLKISGNAKRDGNRIVLQPGSSTLSGLPHAAGRVVPMGSLTLLSDRDAAQRLLAKEKEAHAQGDADAGAVSDSLLVQQFRGSYLVNYLHWRPTIYPCYKPPKIPLDRLKVQGISGGDNVVVMMDARTAILGGCSNDRVRRTTGTAHFLNLLARGTCSSEIGIFATDNAMSFETPVTTWTNSSGDVHTATLQPVITAPVSVWIANADAAEQAVDDVANANLLYAVNKVGVQFEPTYTNVSGNPNAVATIGTGCGSVAAVRGSAFYTQNTLNVYYVGGVNGAFTGVNCARSNPGDGNINYIGTIANVATLPHEIGHAFGLRPSDQGGHTNGVAGFGDNNIMSAGGPATRDLFTLGQAFRMNTHTDQWGGTMLINNGLRPGPGRPCAPLAPPSFTCPVLDRDWDRP